MEKIYTERKNEEDSSTVVLREEIAKLTEENQALNVSLNDSLTATAILQSDLQSYRSQLNERKTMLLQYEGRKDFNSDRFLFFSPVKNNRHRVIIENENLCKSMFDTLCMMFKVSIHSK